MDHLRLAGPSAAVHQLEPHESNHRQNQDYRDHVDHVEFLFGLLFHHLTSK